MYPPYFHREAPVLRFVLRFGGNIAPCILNRCTLTAGENEKAFYMETTPYLLLIGGRSYGF